MLAVCVFALWAAALHAINPLQEPASPPTVIRQTAAAHSDPLTPERTAGIPCRTSPRPDPAQFALRIPDPVLREAQRNKKAVKAVRTMPFDRHTGRHILLGASPAPASACGDRGGDSRRPLGYGFGGLALPLPQPPAGNPPSAAGRPIKKAKRKIYPGLAKG